MNTNKSFLHTTSNLIHLISDISEVITQTSEDLLESQQSQHLSTLESTLKSMIDLNNRLLLLSNLESSLISSDTITDSDMSNLQDSFNKIMTDPLPLDYDYNTNEIYVKYKKRLWQAERPGEILFPLDNPNSSSTNNDNDIVATHGMVKSLICPITQVLIMDPVTSTKCNHSYEKNAILQLIARGGGSCRCPVSGCSNSSVKSSQLEADQALMKALKHQKSKLFK